MSYTLIDQMALLTRLLGQGLSAQALAAQTTWTVEQRYDLQSLGEVLRVAGFSNTLDKRPLRRVPALATPLLLLTRDGAGVVVTDIHGSGSRRSFSVQSPDGKVMRWTRAEMESQYIGYCWFVRRKAERDTRSELPEYTMGKAWFWRVIWRFRAYYAQVVVATVLVNFLALAGSLYIMNVYDRVVPNRAYETLWVLSIGVLIANLFEFAARTARARLTDEAGKKADLVISSALFRRAMAIDLAHRPASSGSWSNNLREFEAVRDFMTSASLLALVDLPFVILFVVVIALLAGPLAWVPILTIPLVVGAGLLAQLPLARHTQAAMKEGSQRQGLAVEAIEGLETLKANNATNWAQQRWEWYTAATAASSLKMKHTSTLVVNFSLLVQQLNTVGLVLWGTYLIHAADPLDRISMGTLIATVILSGRMLAPLSQVAGLMVRFQQARVALQGIDGIVQRKTERDPDRTYVSPGFPRGQLAFSQVGYQYGERSPLVLNNINVMFRPGEKVAILGRIGSGKSTFLRIAAGLYAPTLGNVLFDGIDMRQIDPADLRAHVSMLGQAPRLFFGSLRENLEIGSMDHQDDEGLLAAVERFGLDRIVRAHPLGLDMPLGEDGQGLSGGQRQLVGLARLTLRNPRIVLLDEPTSGLDNMTESRALRALREWAGERTMLIVTHRTQVLPFVDRIIVIDNGRIMLDGPRDRVLRQLAGPQPAPATAASPAMSASGDAVAQPPARVVRIVQGAGHLPRQEAT